MSTVPTRSSRILVRTGLPLLLCALLSLALAVSPLIAGAQSAPPLPATWTVRSGFIGTEAGPSPVSLPTTIFAINKFLPGRLEITQGDKVVFELSGRHTVAVGRARIPLVNPVTRQPNPEPLLPQGGTVFEGRGIVQSGVIEGPDTFTVTFAAQGEFDVVCDIHPPQVMKVVVKPAGSVLPMTPQQHAAAVEAQLSEAYNTTLPALLVQHARVDAVPEHDGTWSYGVSAGFGDGLLGGHRFLPGALTVRAGDSVRWTNPDPVTPHTVTLIPGGGLPGAGPSPYPEGFVDFTSHGGTVYTGDALVHVPVLPDAFMNPARGPDEHASRAIRFDTPGQYLWYCILHLPEMQGVITVLPRG